jgi:hypothetical protein
MENDCVTNGVEHHPLMTTEDHSADPILQTAFSFWSAKLPRTAIGFGLFTKLVARRRTGECFRKWCSEVGLEIFQVIRLAGASSVAVACK